MSGDQYPKPANVQNTKKINKKDLLHQQLNCGFTQLTVI